MITLRSRVNTLPFVGWQPFAIWRVLPTMLKGQCSQGKG
jgi:hypothetical protein